MTNEMAPRTPESFHDAFKTRALLGALLGEFGGVHALRLSHLVWEQAPAFFPEFAAACLDEHQGPRTAAWVIAEEAREIPGAWDLYQAARNVAANRAPEAS